MLFKATFIFVVRIALCMRKNLRKAISTETHKITSRILAKNLIKRIFMTDETKYKFAIKFEGEALDNHVVNAKDLANALYGLSEAMRTINTQFNRDDAGVSLNIRALKQGSFLIECLLVFDYIREFFSLFDDKSVNGFCNLVTIFMTLQDFIKTKSSLDGKAIDKKEIHDNGDATIYAGGKAIKTTEKVVELLENEEFTKSVDRLVSPLTQDGVESLSFLDQYGEKINSVTSEDAERILKNPDDVEVFHRVYRETLSIETASFTAKYQWRVHSEERGILQAKITDEEFIKKVQLGMESFAKNDVLDVDLEMSQVQRRTKLVTTYTIIKVYDHKRRPDQLGLLLDETPQNPS